jgi:TRAP-type C4-dicarboxylate transport system permease small subunit
MGMFSKIIALIYLLVGLYLLNFHFKVISLGVPENIESWIVLIGGVIILITGIRFLMKRAKKASENF